MTTHSTYRKVDLLKYIDNYFESEEGSVINLVSDDDSNSIHQVEMSNDADEDDDKSIMSVAPTINESAEKSDDDDSVNHEEENVSAEYSDELSVLPIISRVSASSTVMNKKRDNHKLLIWKETWYYLSGNLCYWYYLKKTVVDPTTNKRFFSAEKLLSSDFRLGIDFFDTEEVAINEQRRMMVSHMQLLLMESLL